MENLNVLLVVSFAAAVLIDFGFPIVLAVYLARRLNCSWKHWFLGLLVFLLFQGITRIPFMVWLQSQPWMLDALKHPPTFLAFLLFAAFTAGLFEEGGRWLAIRFAIPIQERHWRTGVMLGAGHGGFESFCIGLAALAGLATYLVFTLVPAGSLPLTGDQLAQITDQFGQLKGWEPLLGGWERVATQAIQIAFAVMVLQSFTKGARWWWYALAAHTFVDFTAVGCLRLASQHFGGAVGILITEVLVTVFAIVAVWFVLASRDDGPADTSISGETESALGETPDEADDDAWPPMPSPNGDD